MSTLHSDSFYELQELEEFQIEQEKSENRAELLYYFRNKKLLPIISNNNLKILSINIKEDFDYEYLNDIYTDVCKEKYLSILFGCNLIEKQHLSKTKTFDVIGQIVKSEFIDKNSFDIKKMKNELNKIGILNIDDLDNMLNSYCEIINIIQYKYFSKLYMIMNLLKQQFDLNFVAGSLCKFFSKNYNDYKLNLEMRDCYDYTDEVNRANFTSLELKLSDEDKLNELQKLYSAFDINVVFEKDINKLNANDILIPPNMDMENDNILKYSIDIAKLNSSILEDESFKQIYSAITNHSKVKQYVK